ncbi:MAG: helix-turn-helix transcriptional regulator [Clostridia bacterium]|nr:helix-turn-helix transcriptional regulator [Clostridia bacterium]
MNNITLGKMISSLRKKKGMTQAELAEKMGVTDKAVSKWERDLSCPDISSLPKLAEIFDISVDELMQVKTGLKEKQNSKVSEIIDTVLKAVATAAGVATVALTVLNKLDAKSAFIFLGLGLACLAISSLNNKDGEDGDD